MNVISFTEAIDAFLRDSHTRERLKPSTLHAYRKDLIAAAAALPASLGELTSGAMSRYLDCAIAPSTAARRLSALRTLCAWAVREGYCASDPTATLDVPRRTRRIPRPIRADTDRQAVERAIATAPQPARLALTILRETGMRVGEVLALNLGHITLSPDCEVLHVRDLENRTERIVVLDPTATPESLHGLRVLLRERTGEPAYAPLCRSNRDTRLSYDALHYQWAQVCARVGLTDTAGKPRYTLHHLRHTHATELIEQGQRLEIVQRILGHRDPRSTRGYIELTEAQGDAALERGTLS